MIPAGLIGLCDPAFYYCLISFTIVIVIGLQNISQGYNYCVGTQSCPSQHVSGIIGLQILYILFWTWILNLICKNASDTVAWVLVLIPIVIMCIFMALFILNLYDFGLLFKLPSIFN
jgi:multisubunit Na+/H+ antiporter MnhC subunit